MFLIFIRYIWKEMKNLTKIMHKTNKKSVEEAKMKTFKKSVAWVVVLSVFPLLSTAWAADPTPPDSGGTQKNIASVLNTGAQDAAENAVAQKNELTGIWEKLEKQKMLEIKKREKKEQEVFRKALAKALHVKTKHLKIKKITSVDLEEFRKMFPIEYSGFCLANAICHDYFRIIEVKMKKGGVIKLGLWIVSRRSLGAGPSWTKYRIYNEKGEEIGHWSTPYTRVIVQEFKSKTKK